MPNAIEIVKFFAHNRKALRDELLSFAQDFLPQMTNDSQNFHRKYDSHHLSEKTSFDFDIWIQSKAALEHAIFIIRYSVLQCDLIVNNEEHDITNKPIDGRCFNDAVYAKITGREVLPKEKSILLTELSAREDKISLRFSKTDIIGKTIKLI